VPVVAKKKTAMLYREKQKIVEMDERDENVSHLKVACKSKPVVSLC